MIDDPLRLISTGTGDAGFSSDYTGKRLAKADALFEAMGTIDELSSWLGLCYHQIHDEGIKEIQRHLQRINSQIATDPAHPHHAKLDLLGEAEVRWLENREADILSGMTLDHKFRLPGSETSAAGAFIDMGRAIARRAERQFVAYRNSADRNDLLECGIYLNRLSDLLYLMANKRT